MRIAVSAVQGDFAEHEQVWKEMGIDCIELRSRGDLRRSYDALVLPGGESTVQGKLLRELGMFEPLRKQIRSGLPVLATCAGLILLAEKIANDERSYFQTLPVTVRRNAYGRQLGSFHTVGFYGDLGAIPSEEVIKAIGHIDIMMVPIGAIYTIDDFEARELANIFKPKVVIPMHYKTPKLKIELCTLAPFVDAARDCRIHYLNQCDASVMPSSLGEDRVIILRPYDAERDEVQANG